MANKNNSNLIIYQKYLKLIDYTNNIVKKYGVLPDKYKIVGFDNSLVSREAIIPITTIGQQVDKIAEETVKLLAMQIDERKKRRPHLLESPIHKVLTPVLVRRETTK